MILTVDPVSVIPAFGVKLSAWLSVHLIASDYTTSGCDPQYATFTYNFPGELSERDREEYVMAIGEECDNLGVTIAGGHTGSYPGAGFTVIGSGTMLGFGREGEYVAPSMARVGDTVLMTKHAAIEATVSLATAFPEFVERRIGARLARKARSGSRLCSTVADARAAREVGLGLGGVSSMHDATEGGVLGALGEMAEASKKQFVVNLSGIPVAPEGKAVCSAFGLDPLRTMGEGALLITCAPEAIRRLTRLLARAAVGAAEIGKVREGSGLVAEWEDGRMAAVSPTSDGYWDAYARASERRLR
jgi:hydrogenase maturation factor